MCCHSEHVAYIMSMNLKAKDMSDRRVVLSDASMQICQPASSPGQANTMRLRSVSLANSWGDCG
jgi:hypothetical protein